MRSKIILRKSGQLLYRFVLLFLLFACLALAGCSKNCADYEKALNAYADGSKPIDNIAQVLKDCREALAKCPDLAVAFEVMGDIDAKNKDVEEADKKFDKALELKKDNERVKAKKEKISGALSEVRSKAADDKFDSIKRMSLAEYAQLEESMRITWCEKAINNPTGYVFLGHSPSATFVPQFSGTPQSLDRLLIDLAAKEPSKQVSDAAAMLFTLSNR